MHRLKTWPRVTKRPEGPSRGTRRSAPLLHVSRALKQPGLWLTLTYVALILLMARAYI
jgi:hypothetical protein